MDEKGLKMMKFNPDLILEKTVHFSAPVRAAISAVIDAGSKLYFEEGGGPLHEASLKAGDAGEREFQLVTKGDVWMQEQILLGLSKHFPEANFIVEEKVKNLRINIIQSSDLSLVHEADLLYGVDPIDGTNQFYPGLWEWSISVGVMVRGRHLGGVIFAPAIFGGAMVAGERGKGVFLAENGGFNVSRVCLVSPEKGKGILYTGVGLTFLPQYNSFVNSAAKELPPFKSVGSCALGLAFVAAGRIHAMIQSAQRPYDWFAGYPLVEEAGGKFQFYHYRGGNIVPLDKPDILSYDPGGLHTAFIAGDSKLVDWLFELLLRHWNNGR